MGVNRRDRDDQLPSRPTMNEIVAPAEAQSVELQATVIRADGSRDQLGTVAYWHRSHLRRLWWRLTHRS